VLGLVDNKAVVLGGNVVAAGVVVVREALFWSWGREF
jgi:hypothetical protein